ncbi:PEP-CTERM sorting domain-containing protein [Lacipirellula sp.]|uniref:PEP-CTERM sorting domain-containing protein n=1 Tax=Lacipirellula sp. TaxID=2691419 RepID=UPI003D0A0B30
MLAVLQAVSLAAVPTLISVSLTERRNPSGEITYRLDGAAGLTFSRSEYLITPTGKPIANFGYLEFQSWDALVGESVGDWKFVSTSKTDPSDTQEYGFTISSPVYEELTPQFPTVSPSSLSVVTSPLTITWNQPSSAYSGGASQVAGFKSTFIDPGKLQYVFGKSYDSSARLRFATTESQNLSNLISNVVTPPVEPIYQVTTRLWFGRQTAVEYIPADAVPEPASSLLIAAIGPALLASVRRKR